MLAKEDTRTCDISNTYSASNNYMSTRNGDRDFQKDRLGMFQSGLSECSTQTGATQEEESSDSSPEARAKAARASAQILYTASLTPIPPTPPQQVSAIIFDWDDTLLPTGFLRDALKIYPMRYTVPTPQGRTAAGRQQSSLPPGFPCAAALEAHAVQVRELLKLARSIGRVAIVTMAERPWVVESAKQYMPGLGFPRLLRELDIPVYYAAEYRRCLQGLPITTSTDSAACKKAAMTDFLRSLRGTMASRGRMNVLSIGDSVAEREAAMHSVAALEKLEPIARRPLCKTVKLVTDPSLKEISAEVNLLSDLLGQMVHKEEGFDLIFDNCANLPATAAAVLCGGTGNRSIMQSRGLY